MNNPPLVLPPAIEDAYKALEFAAHQMNDIRKYGQSNVVIYVSTIAGELKAGGADNGAITEMLCNISVVDRIKVAFECFAGQGNNTVAVAQLANSLEDIRQAARLLRFVDEPVSDTNCSRINANDVYNIAKRGVDEDIISAAIDCRDKLTMSTMAGAKSAEAVRATHWEYDTFVEAGFERDKIENMVLGAESAEEIEAYVEQAKLYIKNFQNRALRMAELAEEYDARAQVEQESLILATQPRVVAAGPEERAFERDL